MDRKLASNWRDLTVCLVVVVLVIGIIFLAGLFATVGLVFWFIPWIIVGLLVGAVASALTASRHGLLGDLLIGLAGSVVGGVLFAILFHYRPLTLLSLRGIVAATVGAIILLLIGKVFARAV